MNDKENVEIVCAMHSWQRTGPVTRILLVGIPALADFFWNSDDGCSKRIHFSLKTFMSQTIV